MIPTKDYVCEMLRNAIMYVSDKKKVGRFVQCRERYVYAIWAKICVSVM